MIKKTTKKFIYKVIFWAYPKSGFDVIKKNVSIQIFKKFLETAFGHNECLERDIDTLFKIHEDKVPIIEIVELDFSIKDADKEILPIIQKMHSGVKNIEKIIPFNT
jgi:Zn ribbon nucleic-acid-binding protein